MKSSLNALHPNIGLHDSLSATSPVVHLAGAALGFQVIIVLNIAAPLHGHTLIWEQRSSPKKQLQYNNLTADITLPSSQSGYNLMIIDQFQHNYDIERFSDRIKITIHGHRKWGLFLMTLFAFVMTSLCGFPMLFLMTVAVAQTYLNAMPLIISIGVLIAILDIYLLRRKFLELIDYAFDREVIEIDEHQIKVERSGFLGFKTKKAIPAEEIKGITGPVTIGAQSNVLSSLPFMSSTLIGAITIWKRKSRFRPVYFYGKGLSQADALFIIDAILQKFPQYRYRDIIQQPG